MAAARSGCSDVPAVGWMGRGVQRGVGSPAHSSQGVSAPQGACSFLQRSTRDGTCGQQCSGEASGGFGGLMTAARAEPLGWAEAAPQPCGQFRAVPVWELCADLAGHTLSDPQFPAGFVEHV